MGQICDAAVVEDEYQAASSPAASLPTLAVYFQPIVDMVGGVELGFEALTRLAVAPEQGFPRGLLAACWRGRTGRAGP